MTAPLEETVIAGKKRIVKPEPGPPKYNPTNAMARRLFQMRKTEGMSEYQAAYRKYPFQKPRDCVRPTSKKIETGMASSLMTTTYKKDFVYHEDKDAFKMDSFKPLQGYRPSSARLSDQTIYSLSYQVIDKEVAKKCRPAISKPREAPLTQFKLVLPEKPSGDGDSKSAEEAPKMEVVTESKPCIEQTPVVAEVAAPAPADVTVPQPTSNSTGNKSASTHIVIPGQKPQRAPFNGMTTAMADFVKHPLTARQSICKPPASSTHYDLGPFDGRTTQSMAYQAWPVAPFAKPSWAIKPKYKRPKGGMPYASTYMTDFVNPKHIVERAMPIKPKPGNDIIKHEGGDGNHQSCTTYQGHYVAWKGVLPAKTVQIKQLYVPNAGEMDFQSIQRLHFRGVQAERPNLCHQSSEHRNLNDNPKMYFNTTYQDTFGRPKSCPVN